MNQPAMNLISNFSRSREFSRAIHDLIPGGAHTYSKGDDQFPQNSPGAIVRGEGARVWDLDGNEYIDCSMGLTSVSIGHGYAPVVDAVCEAARNGVNFQRPAAIELDAARALLEATGAGDMVKFAKNGSTATTAAVKLARAFTGRAKVAVAKEHNFFSYDDWFISTTPANSGIPGAIRQYTTSFSYNDFASVEALLRGKDHDVACLIMEPVKFDPPKDDFLHKVADLCKARGVVLILDEMVSGFKWSLKGASHYFGVEADITTWGKGIANGFSACALTGRAEIMELGGIRAEGKDKLFLISTTHGAETTGLAAMIATIAEFRKHGMIESNWRRGTALRPRLDEIIARHRLRAQLELLGYDCFFALACRGPGGQPDDAFRTLMMQEMIARGVLFQGVFYPTWSHQQPELDAMAAAFDGACAVYAEAIAAGSCAGRLVGPACKPVFRKKI